MANCPLALLAKPRATLEDWLADAPFPKATPEAPAEEALGPTAMLLIPAALADMPTAVLELPPDAESTPSAMLSSPGDEASKPTAIEEEPPAKDDGPQATALESPVSSGGTKGSVAALVHSNADACRACVNKIAVIRQIRSSFMAVHSIVGLLSLIKNNTAVEVAKMDAETDFLHHALRVPVVRAMAASAIDFLFSRPLPDLTKAFKLAAACLLCCAIERPSFWPETDRISSLSSFVTMAR